MKKRREVRLYEDKSELEINFINIFWDEIYEKILEAYESGKERIRIIVKGEEFEEDKFYEIDESEFLGLVILKIERKFFNLYINTIIQEVNIMYNLLHDNHRKYKVEFSPITYINLVHDQRYDIIDQYGLIVYPQIKKKK